jgi:hypothetical protein
VNEAKAPAPADARLGILFVHGIGDQPQGMTLVQFAEPLSDVAVLLFSGWILRTLGRFASTIQRQR